MSRRRVLSTFLMIGLMIYAGSFFYTRPSPEAYLYSEQVGRVNSENVDAALSIPEEAKGKLLFLFTSWCPFCKREFPIVEAIAQEYEQQGIVFYPLSIENDILKLSEFMVTEHPDFAYTPHFLLKNAHVSFNFALHNTGSSFKGGIPYIALLDKSGKMVAEFSGFVDKATLKTTLDRYLEMDNTEKTPN